MSIIDKIFPALDARMTRFVANAKKLVAKRTGTLEDSVVATVTPSGLFIHIRIRFRIYALILYHMSKSGYRQRRKKGGRVRGSDRYQGANRLASNSPLKENPEKYQKFIEATFDVRDELEEIAIKVATQKAVEELVKALSE